MANQIFMRVNEVEEELGISIPFAYKIIRQMNKAVSYTHLRKSNQHTISILMMQS